MNMILLAESDFVAPDRVRLDGLRSRHVLGVLGAGVGTELKVGRLQGELGRGVVTAIAEGRVELEVAFSDPPPAPLPVVLVLALPRPKVLRRTLSAAVTMGVKKIYLINSFRVEKSYWQSPRLEPDSLREIVHRALEQAGDTGPVEIVKVRRFRPFVEDRLPGLAAGRQALFLHPDRAASAAGFTPRPPALVAIGPEGGFIPFELERLASAGLAPLSLGARILRVEQAVPTILGRFL
jgi:RsmE family RNA methyltransferase